MSNFRFIRRWLVLAQGTLWVGTLNASAQELPAGVASSAAETFQGGGRFLFRTPGADTIAQLRSGAAPEILEENGPWLKVRIEGWISRQEVGLSALESGNLSLAAIRADPERYQGQTVRWRVQHVALQRADSLRSDMALGEPYLLARDPGGEPGFVYITIPTPLLLAVSNLAPLQRIEIVGRIRSGRSPLTGHPILELVEIRP